MSTELTEQKNIEFFRFDYYDLTPDAQHFLNAWADGLRKDVVAAERGGYKKLSETRPGKFKADWLTALRSGHYLQVKGKLRMTVFPDVALKDLTRHDVGKVGYCCLGLGCNIISHRKGWTISQRAIYGHTWNWKRINSGSTDLPWIDTEAADRLANANDEGVPFTIIADWIEVNL